MAWSRAASASASGDAASVAAHGRLGHRQRHGLVHGQRLGQRPRRARRPDAVDRVVGEARRIGLQAPPAVEAAPARQRQRDRARAQAGAVQLRREALDVRALQRRERPLRRVGQLDQPRQRIAVGGERVRRHAALHAQVLEVALDGRGH
jgi:hypothetical protein